MDVLTDKNIGTIELIEFAKPKIPLLLSKQSLINQWLSRLRTGVICPKIGKIHRPPPNSTQKIGGYWAKRGLTLAIKVSSAIIPSESNYLINPNHKDFFQNYLW